MRIPDIRLRKILREFYERENKYLKKIQILKNLLFAESNVIHFNMFNSVPKLLRSFATIKLYIQREKN